MSICGTYRSKFITISSKKIYNHSNLITLIERTQNLQINLISLCTCKIVEYQEYREDRFSLEKWKDFLMFNCKFWLTGFSRKVDCRGLILVPKQNNSIATPPFYSGNTIGSSSYIFVIKNKKNALITGNNEIECLNHFMNEGLLSLQKTAKC